MSGWPGGVPIQIGDDMRGPNAVGGTVESIEVVTTTTGGGVTGRTKIRCRGPHGGEWSFTVNHKGPKS